MDAHTPPAGTGTDLQTGHARRLAGIDPLVRPGDLDAAIARGATYLTRPGVAGLACLVEEESLWQTRRVHALALWVADDDADVPGVLDDWLALVAGDPAGTDDETSLQVSVPSRDARLVAPLVRRHLGPCSVLAVHPLSGDAPPAPTGPPAPAASGVRVRTAAADDVAWVVDRTTALHAWEAAFGYVPDRADAGEVLAREVPEALERDAGWTWVAEVDGERAGFVQVNPPEAAAWVSGATWLQPVGYVVGAWVEPAYRSTGVGRALVRAAHGRAAEEGWAGVLLHHSGVSPTSGPFWSSLGYRPLVTTWVRRPAVLPT